MAKKCEGCKGGNCPACKGTGRQNGGLGNQVVCSGCKGTGNHTACKGKGTT